MFTINGKRYRIVPHQERRNFDLQYWRQFSKNKQAKTGKSGEWAFDSCYIDFPHLARTILSRVTDDEQREEVQSMLDAWENAVARVTEALELKFKEGSE